MAATDTFTFTGAVQTWTAPSAQTVTLKIWGPGGGDGGDTSDGAGGTGGTGGFLEQTFSVTDGEVLDVYVGGQGTNGEDQNNGGGLDGTGGTGGWGYKLGGDGGNGDSGGGGGGGGGASGVLDGADAVIGTAGAGGGGGGHEFTGSFGGGGGGGARGGAAGSGFGSPTDGGGTGAGGDGGDGNATANDSADYPGHDGGTVLNQGTQVTSTTGGGNTADGKVEIVYEVPPPTLDSVTATAENELTVSWTKEDPYSGGEFEVFRSTDGTLGTKVADGLADTTTSFVDTGVDDGTQYHYTVRRLVQGDTADSNQKAQTTTAPAPTLDSLSVSGDVITANFTDNGDSEDHFEIQVREAGSGNAFSQSGSNVASAAGEGNSLSGSTASLLDGEQYDVRVQAVYPDTTANSSSSTATTELPDVSQPTLGNGVEDEVSVSWSDVIDNGDYRIQIEETGTGSDWVSTDEGWAETTVGEATTSHNFTGREDGEEYRVRMRTETAHVTGAWTSPVSIVTKFPAASNLSATAASTTQIDLTWTDNSDNEDNFIVERREVFRTGAGPWSDIATLSANTTSYSDTGLNINTTYDYKIRAETEHTTATSGTVQKTTNDDGVTTDRVPAEGWFVVIEDTQGAVYRPPIVGEPALNPKLNDYSTVQVPVSRNERWEDNKWERQPMRVYHDGERQPIEEVRDIRQEPDKSVIQGVGGTELRQKVSTDIIEKDAHTTAKDLISNNTTYTANVDNPSSTTTNNVLEQSADSKSEWEGNLLNGAPAADAIYEATNGFLQSRQTAYFVEAENADTVVSDGQVIEQESNKWSNETVEELTQVEQNNAFRKIKHTFTIDHKIPESRVESRVRIQVPNTGNHGFEIRINGTAIEDIGKDTLVDNETSPDWFVGTVSAGDTGDLAAGDHTLTFILQESSANNGTIYVDCMSLYDTTVTPNFTETVNSGVLTGPDLFPSANQVQTSDATTVKQVVGGKLESTWNNTLNSQEVAISNDAGGSWKTSANSETVSSSFASGSTTIRARFTISGYDTNTGASPKGRKATQTVDLYNLYADLDDTPLLANRSWDNDLKSILNDIADFGDFIWEVRYDGGFSIEWTQPGQRTNTIDPGLVDYSVTTDFSSIHRKAIIYGTHVPVTNEQFTSNHDTFVALNNDWMAETGETVTTTDGSTQYDRGSDYELKPNAGEIKVLSTGAMSDATTYEIDYFRRIRGSFTSDAHDGTYETLVETLNAITTQRNADQAALSIVKNASTPITTATVTIRKPPTGLNLVEAIDVDELPTGESLEVWDVENKPRQTILRLGSREPIEETINRIQSRLASTSKKV